MWRTISICVAFLALAAPQAAAGGGGLHPADCEQEPGPSASGAVHVAESCYRPKVVAVSTGGTVRWTSTSEVPHTVTFAEDIDSGSLSAPFAVRFNRPGTFVYACTYHPAMTGTVSASGAALEGPPMEVVSDAAPPGDGRTGVHPLWLLPVAMVAAAGGRLVRR